MLFVRGTPDLHKILTTHLYSPVSTTLEENKADCESESSSNESSGSEDTKDDAVTTDV